MKLVMLCWNCGKEHEPRALSSFEGPYICECGGYVVSPSGKVQLKRVREPDTTYLCKSCGRPGELRDNETYCETCGPGVELVVVPDEASVYGCRSGRCEF